MSEDMKKLLMKFRTHLTMVVADIDSYLGATVQEKPRAPTDVATAFPEDLRSQLTFSEVEGYHIIRPKQYLGKETFRKVIDIVQGQTDGEYVSAGKDSHFRIPRSAR